MATAPLIDPAVFKRRFIEHWAYAVDFCEGYNKKYGCSLSVDSNAMFLAVKSAYDDVERYKLYHLEQPNTQKSNAVKRAAYLVKWLVRCVPIRAMANGNEFADNPSVVEYLGNTIFAISRIRLHLEAELKTPFQFSDKKVYKLAYDLTFRELSGDALLSLIQDYYDTLRSDDILIRQQLT